jgi:hypothetical protein
LEDFEVEGRKKIIFLSEEKERWCENIDFHVTRDRTQWPGSYGRDNKNLVP